MLDSENRAVLPQNQGVSHVGPQIPSACQGLAERDPPNERHVGRSDCSAAADARLDSASRQLCLSLFCSSSVLLKRVPASSPFITQWWAGAVSQCCLALGLANGGDP